jgi:transcriptional regulator with GAF, ATPase, and Fis domain
MESKEGKPILRVHSPDAPGAAVYVLEEGEATIGRAQENTIVLQDSLVSRQHAAVCFDGKTVILRDLGGKNPIRVNGRDVEDYQLLDGDRIAIGQSEIVVEFPAAGRGSTRLRVVKDRSGPTAAGGGGSGGAISGMSVDASTLVFDDSARDAPTAAKDLRRLAALYRLTEKILKVTDQEQLFDEVLATATTECQAERGFLGLVPQGHELDPYALNVVRFWDPEHGGNAQTLEMSETILRHIQRDRKAVLVRDVPEQPDFGMSVIDLKIRSFIGAPLTYGDEFLGLIYVDTRGARQQFDRSDLHFVSAIGRIAGLCLENLRTQADLQRENERLRSLVFQSGAIVGSSEAMERVFRLIEKVAPRDTSVLIVGENGTGKELIARAVHDQSHRKDKPFVAVNCGAIPPNLVESELFGYERGAFTGAERTTEGKFDFASGGTLFLDEIGDMPLDMQVKILRAIQERKFYRVGGKKEVTVDIRVISATNQDLKKAVEAGTFREDLYFRLAVVTIEVPPLRERGEDILEIADHFLNQGSQRITITKSARECLLNYEWPGNIRELRNALEQAVILGDGQRITPADLPPEIGKTGRGKMVFRLKTLGEVEKQYIVRVLDEVGGNKARAAQILGISRETLYQKLKQYQAVPRES